MLLSEAHPPYVQQLEKNFPPSKFELVLMAAHQQLRHNFFNQHPTKTQLKRIHSQRKNNKDSQWKTLSPIVNQLISTYGAFYNRSHDLPSAQKWEVLRAQGYKPAKRSVLDTKWWNEERSRGRVQPDHQISRSLLDRPSRLLKTPPDRRSFSSKSSTAELPTLGLLRSSSMIRKDSPDVLDLIGNAIDLGLPDVGYGGLDPDPAESSTWMASVGKLPGSKGFSGLQPGSFIELRRANQSETGIVVSVIASEVIYVSRSGEIRLNSLDNVMYTMHHLVDPSIAKEAIDPEISLEGLADPIVRAATANTLVDQVLLGQKATTLADARKHCCRALRVIDAKLDHCHAILTKAGSYNLYHHFKHLKQEKTAQLSTGMALEFLLGKDYVKDEIMHFALHQQLMANSDMFIANAREMRDQSTFSLQSEETLEALHTVQDWVSRDSIELKLFVDKARKVIQANQNLQNSTDSLLPLQLATISFPPWTQSDLLFIKVFRTIAITHRMIQAQPLSTVVAAILKKIGLYDQQAMLKTWPALTFDRMGAIVFLRDIGVLPAWQNIGLWDPNLDLKSRYQTYLANKANLAHDKPLQRAPLTRTIEQRLPTPTTETLEADPTDALRYDFGDMPVYIIDDANAEELDDGVSIELLEDPVYATPQRAWIHVHIADPTTCLHPSHPIAMEARKYLETLYLPASTLPMLPSGFISTHKLSLGVNAKEGGGQRTLSFSALLDLAGNILDHKIRPGFVKCTKQVTYELVTTIIDGHPPPSKPTLNIGQHSQSQRTEARPTLTLDQLDADDRARLKQLANFAASVTRRRIADGALGWNLPTPSVTVHGTSDFTRPRFFIPPSPKLTVGIPSVTVHLPTPIDDHRTYTWGINSAQALVSEFMILAGRLAGRILDPDLILPFRTQAPPELTDAAGNVEALSRLRKQISSATGLVSPFVFQKARVKFLPAAHALKASHHAPLGIIDKYGYCKVTSPLRRYSDLVAHWQLKSSLLRSSGREPAYTDSQRILERRRMEELVGRLDRETKGLQTVARKLEKSWITYAMSKTSTVQEVEGLRLRGVICGEPVLVKFTNMWSMKVYILELGLKATLIAKAVEDWFLPATKAVSMGKEGDDVVGLCVPVKIVYVNQDDHLIVEAVRERMSEMMMMV